MQQPARSVQVSALVLALLTTFAAASCDRTDESWDGAVTISVDLETGQEWTAQGGPVDRGQFCPSGTRHVVEGIDPRTNDVLRVHVWFDIMEDAITTRNSTPITLVVEHACADGSGSFLTTERWGPDEWAVESGTGAYRELRGGGELSFATVDHMTVAPLRLHLDGVLTGRGDRSGAGGPAGVPSAHVPITTRGSVHARHRRRRSPVGR